MKSTLLILVFLAMILPGQAAAQRNIGVGLILGDPVRLTIKKWLSRDTAIDAAINRTGSGDSGGFRVHIDYLKHNFKLFSLREGKLPIHYGVGVRIESGDNLQTAIRIPIGASFIFRNAPLSIFYEYAFFYDLTTPGSTLKSETALGFRYYF